jgi:hypothetical protein
MIAHPIRSTMAGKKIHFTNISISRAASTIDRAARNLIDLHGESPLKTADIKAEICRISDYGDNSIPPSDHCYNLINKGLTSFRFHIFEWLSFGYYCYLGPGYKYSGSIFWKGKVFGKWDEGKYHLWEDPR